MILRLARMHKSFIIFTIATYFIIFIIMYKMTYQIPSWKEAYLKYISQDKDIDSDTTTFVEIFVDNNRIPEIVIDYGDPGIKIISYQNGVVFSQRLFSEDGFRFIKKSGLIYSESISDVNEYIVCRLDINGFSVLGKGECCFEKPTYFIWNKNYTSQEKFYESLNSLFDSDCSSGLPNDRVYFNLLRYNLLREIKEIQELK